VLAFIHVAKTGGQTIQKLLASSFGAGFCDPPVWPQALPAADSTTDHVIRKYGPEDLRHLLRLCPWTRCVGGHPVALWSGFEDVTPVRYFAFVRDPLKRGASHFQYNLQDTSQRPRQWDEWVDYPVHHNHQVKMFSPSGLADDAIERIIAKEVFVGLTEKFNESLLLLKRLVVPELNVSYLRANTAENNKVARSLLADPGACETLARIYGEEIKLMKFIEQEWYPGWVKRYGPTLESDLEGFAKNPGYGFNRPNYYFSRINHHLLLQPAVLCARWSKKMKWSK
jgi:hypothetical protein